MYSPVFRALKVCQQLTAKQKTVKQTAKTSPDHCPLLVSPPSDATQLVYGDCGCQPWQEGLYALSHENRHQEDGANAILPS